MAGAAETYVWSLSKSRCLHEFAQCRLLPWIEFIYLLFLNFAPREFFASQNGLSRGGFSPVMCGNNWLDMDWQASQFDGRLNEQQTKQ